MFTERVHRYLMAAGGVRAFVKSGMSNTYYYDERSHRRNRPHTVTERVAISALGAVLFPWTFPLCIYNDANRIELKVRGFESASQEAKINGSIDILF